MELTEFIRKSFTVKAVEVTFENYRQVAEWCKGTVELETARMLGTETKLPVIKLKGQGDNRGKEFTATLGCYIVELKGSFRVYKQAAFFSAFEQKQVALAEALETISVSTTREKAETEERGIVTVDEAFAQFNADNIA